jgi:hypothetical protein
LTFAATFGIILIVFSVAIVVLAIADLRRGQLFALTGRPCGIETPLDTVFALALASSFGCSCVTRLFEIDGSSGLVINSTVAIIV